MTPKKRKLKGTSLKEEEKPEITIDFPEEESIPTVVEDGMKKNIDRIKTQDGVIGYILRNSKSASIDLKDPTKIIDYATLSSSAFEASEELSETFDMGDIKHTLVEGDRVKFLSLTDGENKVSVFMDKKVNHKRIYKDLLD
jgi:predicted regulator of Ras-like GTPase activity (Roadblock/LC7/MglB family)